MYKGQGYAYNRGEHKPLAADLDCIRDCELNAENEKVLGMHAWYNYHYGQHDPVPIGRFCEVLRKSKEKDANGQPDAEGLVDSLINELSRSPWEADEPEPSTKHGSTELRVN